MKRKRSRVLSLKLFNFYTSFFRTSVRKQIQRDVLKVLNFMNLPFVERVSHGKLSREGKRKYSRYNCYSSKKGYTTLKFVLLVYQGAKLRHVMKKKFFPSSFHCIFCISALFIHVQKTFLRFQISNSMHYQQQRGLAEFQNNFAKLSHKFVGVKRIDAKK